MLDPKPFPGCRLRRPGPIPHVGHRFVEPPVAFANTSSRWDDLILVPQNATPSPAGVAARIAARTLAKRGPDYTDEVRRILNAALAVMGQRGIGSKVRVADIVSAAGVSNDTFYRHF